MKKCLSIKRLSQMVADIGVEIAELKLIYLFGSHVEGYIGPLSDYDFGVLLERKNGTSEYRSLLYSAFAKKLGTDLIDVILLKDAPVELAFHIISYGELLYESNVESRIEYESKVMGLYFDYLPILRAQRYDILKGGEHATRVQRYREAFGRTQRTLGQIRALQR